MTNKSTIETIMFQLFTLGNKAIIPYHRKLNGKHNISLISISKHENSLSKNASVSFLSSCLLLKIINMLVGCNSVHSSAASHSPSFTHSL